MSSADLDRLIHTVRRLRSGDLSARVTWRSGPLRELAAELNGLVADHERFHRDAARVSTKIVRDGRPDARLTPPVDSPLLAATAHAINDSMDALLAPGADIARVIGAVAAGDLSARVITPGGPVYKGAFRERALIVDSMVGELSQLADELTRVTRQFGTEGRLGGQAQVPGVSITKTSTLGIASDTALVYHVDGEPHVGGQCVSARIHSRALRVISAIR